DRVETRACDPVDVELEVDEARFGLAQQHVERDHTVHACELEVVVVICEPEPGSAGGCGVLVEKCSSALPVVDRVAVLLRYPRNGDVRVSDRGGRIECARKVVA